jgi:serine/threonine-protein kinase HipA
MADGPTVASVYLWDKHVGAIAEDIDGRITFEFTETFRRSGPEISPQKLPLSLAAPIMFEELRNVPAFQGLPGVFADSLPDRFGNAVITKYFESKGNSKAALSPVQKLLYVGKRAMGALEYRPSIADKGKKSAEAIEIARLVDEARKIVEGTPDIALPEIMRIGSSAGGARPKAIVLWNQEANQIKSAFAPFKTGEEHWILKFDGVGELDRPDRKPAPYNRTEYVYGLLARKAGIDVAEQRLLEERDFAHLMVKRFDRNGTKRIHMHSLAGMEHVDYNTPREYSYEQYLRVILKMSLGHTAIEEGFRRAIFNIVARNQDDHVKNLSFLMDQSGAWRLSPAYDLTYSKGSGFTRTHQMTFAGKDDDFTKHDIEEVGGEFSLKRNGLEILEQVVDAVGAWPALAKKAGVPGDRIKNIQQGFRFANARQSKAAPVAAR